MTAKISAHVLVVNFKKAAHKGNRKKCANSLIFHLHIFPHFPSINLAAPLKIITFGGVVDCYLLWRVEPDAPAIQEQEKVYTILIPKDTTLMAIISIVIFIMSLIPMTGVSSPNYVEQLQIGQTTEKSGKYQNPIINASLPDPSIIKAHDGHFYLYATENIRNLPIYRSDNLVDWDYVGTAFDDESRPKWNPNGRIWAPDINFFDGQYVLYYSKSVWGGEWTCGIGVATAVSPKGPFTDRGALFISEDIGVRNSIDPFFMEDGGKKYVFWGSFHGIYGIELTDDGLAVKPGSAPVPVAGNQMEGSYIHKRGDYYYLFGSNGSCCEGANSTYQVVYGRSKSLFGPYLTKEGQPMLEGHYNVLLHGNEKVAGPGHNAEFITDDKGKTWMLYHGYLKSDPDAGRQVFMDKVEWIDGWPLVAGSEPSSNGSSPSIE